MKIAFYWQGVSGRYGQWNDGLRAALEIIKARGNIITMLEPGVDAPKDTDIILYWEAPITLQGKDADKYRHVIAQPYPKALLFAGGRVDAKNCYGFDLYFVESKINEEEFEALGLPWKRAFGVNTQIFKPEKQPKVFDGFMQATYAGWKRHSLFAEALGRRGACAGRKQAHEPFCYEICEQKGVLTLPELSAEAVASMINGSRFVVNTAEYWGGGQRCTLEAMACGVPVIVMSDSPKNCEYVQEAESMGLSAGVPVEPTPEGIRGAIAKYKRYEELEAVGRGGVEYVRSRWTETHYADALLEGILDVIHA